MSSVNVHLSKKDINNVKKAFMSGAPSVEITVPKNKNGDVPVLLNKTQMNQLKKNDGKTTSIIVIKKPALKKMFKVQDGGNVWSDIIHGVSKGVKTAKDIIKVARKLKKPAEIVAVSLGFPEVAVGIEAVDETLKSIGLGLGTVSKSSQEKHKKILNKMHSDIQKEMEGRALYFKQRGGCCQCGSTGSALSFKP